MLSAAGAVDVCTRYALYLPPVAWPPLVARAELLERVGRPLGPLGAGFVVAHAAAPLGS